MINQQPSQAKEEAPQQTMNVTAEHAGGAVVLELDEGCRSVAALRRIVSAALPDVKEDGFDVTVQGRAVEDVDVCGLEEGATIQVVVSRRVVALDALRAAGRDVSEDEMKGANCVKDSGAAGAGTRGTGRTSGSFDERARSATAPAVRLAVRIGVATGLVVQGQQEEGTRAPWRPRRVHGYR